MSTKVAMLISEAKKQKDRAVATRYYCSASDCPLLRKGKCIHMQILGSCIYGTMSCSQTHTKQAKSYLNELSNLKEEKKEFPKTSGYYGADIVKIDEYYYIPYNHVTMCIAVPFHKPANILSSGSPFLHKDDFNVDNMIKLIKFRPQAIFGGEILSYQRTEVPKLLINLKNKYPELYQQVIDQEPSIASKTPDVSSVKSLKATLLDVPDGSTDFKVRVGANHYFEVLSYDGTNITIRGPYSALITIIGPHTNGDCTLEIDDVIKDKTEVLIENQELIQVILENNPSLYK